MPASSFTKADPAPSVDLFPAGTLLCHLSCVLGLRSWLAVSCCSALSLTLFRERLKIKWNSAESLSLIKLSEKFAEWLTPFPFPACTACAPAAVDKRALEWIAVVCVCVQSVCVWVCLDSKHHLHLALRSRCVQLPCPHPLLRTPTKNWHGSCPGPVWWWVTHVTAMNVSSAKRIRKHQNNQLKLMSGLFNNCWVLPIVTCCLF